MDNTFLTGQEETLAVLNELCLNSEQQVLSLSKKTQARP